MTATHSHPMMLTISDAQALGRMGKSSVYRQAALGHYSVVKLGRRTLIPRAEFEAFLNKLPHAALRPPKDR